MTDSQPSQGPETTTPKGKIARIAPLLAIGAGLALFFALGLQRYFSLDALRDNRELLLDWVEAAPLRAAIIFGLIYAGAVAISLPGASILTIFGGFLFGVWPGSPIVVTAATAGAVVIFLASKTALSGLLSRKAGGLVQRMEDGFREDELSYMFLLRLIPAFPFWAINIAAGLVGVKLRNFLIGTFFGIIPGSLVYTSIGAGAGAAFDAGEEVTLGGAMTQPAVLAPLIGLILLALLPIVLKRFSKRARSLKG